MDAKSDEEPRKKQELARHYVLNTLAVLFDTMGRFLITLFLNPHILSYLGTTQFGIWQVLSRMIDYLSTPGGRPAQALKTVIVKGQLTQSDETRQQIVGAAVATWLIFSPVYFIGGLLTALYLPSLVDVPLELVYSTRVAIAILTMAVFLRELSHIPGAVLAGMNQGFRVAGVKSFAYLTMFLVALGLFKLGVGLEALSLGQATAGLTMGLVGFGIAKKALPWLKARRPAPGDLGRFLKFNAWFLVNRLLDLLITTGPVLLVGFLGSLDLVAMFTLTNLAPNLILAGGMQLVGSAIPGLGGQLGSGQLTRVIRIRGEILLLLWLFITLGGVGTVLFNHSFVSIWVGAEHYGGYMLTLLMVIMSTQEIVIRVDSMIINVGLDLRVKTFLNLASTVITITLGVFAFNFYGMEGLCLGFILGRSLQSLGYPYLVGRALKLSVRQQLAGMMRAVSVTLLLSTLLAVSRWEITADSWFSLLPLAAMVTPAIALALLFLGLNAGQRQQLTSRVRQILKHK